MSEDYILKYVQFKDIDFNDPFFDSLRNDYNDFERWHKSHIDRYAYVQYNENNHIESFLYFKFERDHIEDVSPEICANKILKIGTFKINAHGTKLGERFIKKSLDYAMCNDVDICYLTIYKKQTALINLLSKYGFIHKANKNDELVLVKDLRTISNDIYSNYPIINAAQSKKYILSVYPKYHTRLFPDSKLNNENIDILSDVSHTNSIHKTYISKMWGLENLKKGDIIVIYRTREYNIPAKYSAVVTSICVVTETKPINSFRNFSEFSEYANSYSVFDNDELSIWYNNQEGYVIKMMYNIALSKRIIRDTLINTLGISGNHYWGFFELTENEFRNILRYGQVNERYIR